MTKPIFGLSAALVTPYTASGAVDLAKLARHAGSVLARGCDSVTLCGTTGEGFGLSLDERKVMYEAVATTLPADTRINVGIMASAIDDAVAQSLAALDAGAAGLLMAPPFYMKGMNDDGLYSWFNQVF
ncbi:dihydrodipicolinate synthase family protein, partial [uncultured Hoeflea sp.]|uniref:dihydrodipicolinate synthase family protein n=1 Tax=uncultured Hoeflea sp. TaxID=538666 RepID=UPI0030D9F765